MVRTMAVTAQGPGLYYVGSAERRRRMLLFFPRGREEVTTTGSFLTPVGSDGGV